MYRLLSLLFALFVSAPAAHADGDPTTDAVPRALPYQGVLEIDGEPITATGDDALAIEFALYTSAESVEPVYRQQIRVEVYRGRFTAVIGPVDDQGVPIEQVVRAADGLLLGMTLLGDVNNPDDDIALSNRQRLMATPYALWTTAAANFTVAADLTVGGNVRMNGGTLDLGGGTLTGVGTLDSDLVLPAGGTFSLDNGTFTLGAGTLDLDGGTVAGDVAFNGQIAAQGLQVGDHVYAPRYHISHAEKGSTVLLDQARIERLCGDADGCQVRIGMRLWRNAADPAAASREFLLYYDAPSRRWRLNNDNEGVLGDGRTQHVFVIFETCYLTDSAHTDFRNEGDDGLGFKLLLGRGFNGPDRTCELTFID
jgi:hypothetical protein